MVVLWILVGAIIVFFWLISDGSSLCPSCGLELVSSPLDRLGEDDRLDWCGRCGWRRRR
jgi:hypothetical protein